jgi:hypothetical protein
LDTNLSISLIDNQGTELEKARLAYVLFGTEPAPDVVQPLIDLQNKDGGFPFGMTAGNLSAIDQTLLGLLWLDELGMMESSAAVKAIHFLYGIQKEDGGWDESVELKRYPLPVWTEPGDLHSRLYLTAHTAYWLAVSGRTNRSNFHMALQFLIEQRGKVEDEYGFLHTSWITASVFLLAGRRYTEVAQSIITFLTAKPLSEWESSQIAWALDYLSAAGLPENHPFVVRALAELVQRQAEDGSWASEDGKDHVMSTTIQILKVLGYYDLL